MKENISVKILEFLFSFYLVCLLKLETITNLRCKTDIPMLCIPYLCIYFRLTFIGILLVYLGFVSIVNVGISIVVI